MSNHGKIKRPETTGEKGKQKKGAWSRFEEIELFNRNTSGRGQSQEFGEGRVEQTTPQPSLSNWSLHLMLSLMKMLGV